MVFGQLLNSVFGVSKEAVYQKVKDNLLGGYDNLEDVVDDIATDVTGELNSVGNGDFFRKNLGTLLT